MEQAVSDEINTAKLLAVEKLLWGHTPRKPGEGKQGKYHNRKQYNPVDIAMYSKTCIFISIYINYMDEIPYSCICFTPLQGLAAGCAQG